MRFSLHSGMNLMMPNLTHSSADMMASNANGRKINATANDMIHKDNRNAL